jgi:hypothetical protein
MEDMQVIQEGQHWLIARNVQMLDMNGISGSRSRSANRVRRTYDCWAGERWCGQTGMAKVFPTAEEARQYMEENLDRLIQS